MQKASQPMISAIAQLMNGSSTIATARPPNASTRSRRNAGACHPTQRWSMETSGSGSETVIAPRAPRPNDTRGPHALRVTMHA